MIDTIHATEERASDKASGWRVATRQEDALCWVSGLGFLAWDGKRWKRDPQRAYTLAALAGKYAREESAQLFKLAAAAETKAKREELEKEAAALWRWAKSSENDPRIRGTLRQLESMLQRDFAEIDAHHNLLNVANGTIDLATGELRPHDPGDYLTALCPVAYDPAAEAPKWQAHIEWMMEGNQGLMGYLQRVAGSALIARSERLLHFLYGRGANGKNVFADTLLGVLGEDYAVMAPPDLLLSSRQKEHPAEVAALRGRRLAVLSEVENGRGFNLQRLKSLTGDRIVSARFMRENWMRFPRTWTLLMLANHKPHIQDSTESTWDRLRLVPCRARIKAEKKVEDYDLQLIEEEAPGILAWAVEGCRIVQEQGMGDLPEIAEEVAQYRFESDSLAQFLADGACIREEDARAPAMELRRAYERYCADRELQAIPRNDFRAELANKGIQRTDRTGQGYFYLGVTLVADPMRADVQ